MQTIQKIKSTTSIKSIAKSMTKMVALITISGVMYFGVSSIYLMTQAMALDNAFVMDKIVYYPFWLGALFAVVAGLLLVIYNKLVKDA